MAQAACNDFDKEMYRQRPDVSTGFCGLHCVRHRKDKYHMLPNSTLCSVLALTALSLFFIVATNQQLAKKHGSDIRVIWYFFGLAITLSLMLAYWARTSGTIDSQGNFQGSLGQVLSFMLTASLDLEGSMILVIVIVIVVIAPQLVSFFLSGLAGCGSAPLFIDTSLWLIAWGLIKSMAVAAGVAAVIPTYAYLNGWSGATASLSQGMALLALMLLALAFASALLYRDLLDIPAFMTMIIPRRLRGAVLRARRWMSRNEP